jgi:hypothetical protein
LESRCDTKPLGLSVNIGFQTRLLQKA